MPDNLKKGWTRVAFGDVVQLCRERSGDPAADGFERYVGLDHLEPGDLKIRRWGNVADGTTFTNVFRAGQVLFGKRRAYQRKVAVADFDGVCSGDIYVFEPKSDKLLPELLPFICQTDGFFDHAIGTSAGSLSPRTNWDSLAGYEFSLPPIEEQRRIAEVLEAASSTIACLSDTSECALKLARSQARTSMVQFERDGARMQTLGEIGSVVTGRTPSSSEPGCWGNDIPFVTPGDMEFVAPRLSTAERGLTKHGAEHSVFVPSGSVLVVCIGSTIGKVARCEVPVSFNQQINAVSSRDVDSRYLFMCLLECGQQLASSTATTAVPIVNKTSFSQIRIPVPSVDCQRETAKYFSSILAAREQLMQRIEDCRRMKGHLVQTLLEENI